LSKKTGFGNSKKKRIAKLIESLIRELGDNPDREGLLETPTRVAKAYAEMFRGYDEFDFTFTNFNATYSGIVARIGVPFYSYCEHHMLPYNGVVHFGYIPNGRVVGASKLIRFILHSAARLTIQEELTESIADTFMEQVQPRGCMVIVSASHLCEACRGVKVPGVPFVTDTIRGIFAEEPSVKAEFLATVQREWTKK